MQCHVNFKNSRCDASAQPYQVHPANERFMQATTMWKRFQGQGREGAKHAQIGNPVLLETTYDEDQLRRNPNVADVQNTYYQHNAPAPLLS